MVAMGLETQDENLLEKVCKTADLTFLKPPLRSHANDIHTAMTPVDWGIAETGTLVLDSSSEDVRIATMLSETHVALLLKEALSDRFLRTALDNFNCAYRENRSAVYEGIDFSSFVVNVLKASSKDFNVTGEKVAYHSPCHLCRGMQVTNEPRKLIEIAGYQYVPSKDEDVCCGFGGSYSVDFPEISAEILKKKLDDVQAADARLLVSDCPGCVLQLGGGMDKRGGEIQVKHITELIAETKI